MSYMDIANGVAGAAASAFDIWGQHEANRQNRHQAQDQRDWQTYMSNTAWQRGVADMKAAGINPMLAVSQGGAGTPPGAQAKMENEMAGTANSALAARRLSYEIENLRASNDKIHSDVRLNDSLANSAKATTATTLANLPEKQANSRYWTVVDRIAQDASNSAKTLYNTYMPSKQGIINYGKSLYNRYDKWSKDKSWKQRNSRYTPN